MPRVTFLPSGRTVEVEAGATLLDAYWLTGMPPLSDCGGAGTCGKCQVRFQDKAPAPGPIDTDLLSPVALQAGYRLACQIVVRRDMVVEVLPPGTTGLRAALEARMDMGLEFAPWVRRGPDGRVFFGDAALPGDHASGGSLLGVGLDIGTTTISCYLLDLESGAQIEALAMRNPQAAFGADVISRIAHCMDEPDGLKTLQRTVVAGVNRLLVSMLKDSRHNEDEIKHIAVVGNPTMMHIFMGVDPIPIANAPFTPRFTGPQRTEAAALGIKAHPSAVVETLPLVSGYVGADSVAMALFLRLDQRQEDCLAIDVGTNGEMYLAQHGKLIACSAAAGPAFEGAKISCGMRAEEGAITAAGLDASTGRLVLRTVGNSKPRGLSGSGLVSTVAALLDAGVVLPSGRFSTNSDVPVAFQSRLRGDGPRREFLLAEGNGSADVTLTQRDLRELQLAKAAIAAGFRRMLEYASLDVSNVEHLYLAGAFGSHLDPRASVRIGLLPGLPVERVVPVGNAAGSGAKMVIYSRAMRQVAVDIAAKTQYIELSSDPRFNELFVEEMAYPSGHGP